VRILDNLFGPHADNLSAAMNRATQRHGLLTNNLANVNTPGYKRRDVDFAVALQEAQSGANLADRTVRETRGSSRSDSSDRSNQATVQEGDNRTDGNSVDLEQEVTKIAETELRYQALTDMTSRYFAGLKSVIREAK
jgi:flagellar basal-body rod protein FlgB